MGDGKDDGVRKRDRGEEESGKRGGQRRSERRASIFSFTLLECSSSLAYGIGLQQRVRESKAETKTPNSKPCALSPKP